MEKGKRSLCLEPLERERGVRWGMEVEIVVDTGARQQQGLSQGRAVLWGLGERLTERGDWSMWRTRSRSWSLS